jgi:anti-sigma factor RsiW
MTNPSSEHLSEDDRQRAAEGSLDAEGRVRVDAHRAVCRACDDDVARLTALMSRIDESRHPSAPVLDELWPEIRRQIDDRKLVSLEAETALRARLRRIDPWWIGVAAAFLVVVGVSVYRAVPSAVSTVVVGAVNDSIFRLADDSVKTYEAQANALLDDLKLERARLMPETKASIDDDLKTVDLAIAELQAAIARDPKNPTLRSMLASSYRQKVDVLKKISNAS